MSDGSVNCPQGRRVFTRRKMQDKWRRSPRWKKLVEEHAHTPEAVCVYCGRHHGQTWINSKGDEKKVTLTINHTSRHLYASEDLYLTWDSRYMEIVCVSCNRQYERGMKPCPVCLKEGRITYILDRDAECWSCYYKAHPEEKRVVDANKDRFRQEVRDYNARQAQRRRKASVKHPCKKRRRSGACSDSPINAQCPFAATKAARLCDPDKFVAKKGALGKGRAG